MITIPKILGIFNKAPDLTTTDNSFSHSFFKLLNNWAIEFHNRNYFFVEPDTLVIFTIEPFFSALPFEFTEQTFYIFLFFVLF